MKKKGIIMKQACRKLLSLVMLLSTAAIMTDEHVAPFLQFRSEGRDTARKLVGTTSHHVYLDDMESFYGTFNMTLQYDRSFRGNVLLNVLLHKGAILNDSSAILKQLIQTKCSPVHYSFSATSHILLKCQTSPLYL